MPTTYAHWRFGQDCIQTLPDELQKIILEHIDFFNIGVHGPDIFFYDLKHHEIADFGSELHEIPSIGFFENTKEVYKAYEEKEEMLAYILGFISHFALDSTCHGYVERKKEVSQISHNKIEAEWDGHLIIQDNRFVNLVDRAESLKPTKRICRIISYFFPFEQEEVYYACKQQKKFIGLLNYTSPIRFHFFDGLLHILNKEDFRDLLISPKENYQCIDSNLRLDKLRKKATKLYPKLVSNYLNYLNGNTKQLNSYFEHNFEQWPDYQEIPILNLEKELQYNIK